MSGRPRSAPKRERLRLARAELLVQLACTADRWKHELDGTEYGGKRGLPVEEWPPDDPFRVLMRVYGLTAHDLARVCDGLGGDLERRAERVGYADTWDHDDPPARAGA